MNPIQIKKIVTEIKEESALFEKFMENLKTLQTGQTEVEDKFAQFERFVKSHLNSTKIVGVGPQKKYSAVPRCLGRCIGGKRCNRRTSDSTHLCFFHRKPVPSAFAEETVDKKKGRFYEKNESYINQLAEKKKEENSTLLRVVCEYVFSRGLRQGERCEKFIEAGTEFCSEHAKKEKEEVKQCKHIMQQGLRQGKKCEKFVKNGTEFCHAHTQHLPAKKSLCSHTMQDGYTIGICNRATLPDSDFCPEHQIVRKEDEDENEDEEIE
ncbi:MAG: hypothetical protein Solivirus2_54 [Solivirus sp.]|jgi:hypothetical protein|uniref:Uncharacterized protein n=1 Tax=Solivirus sp. TaxID=2487772 RepID=A0A3G5AJE7_9VIRU|nr:MAG: hypothetical protein Solivirus2_54 [Solivirus sp.]